MIHYDPLGTLVRVVVSVFLAGIAWALLAALLIRLGSTRLRPCIPPGQIWSRWRERRSVWGGALISTFCGTLITTDTLWRQLALPDLYWQSKTRELTILSWTGASVGYFAVLLGFVLSALAARRRMRPPRS